MAFPLAQMEEESYQQAKKDEETEKRYRQDFDDWWARYQETAKKWWSVRMTATNQNFLLFKFSKYSDVTLI